MNSRKKQLNDNMACCTHRICGTGEKVWLPYQFKGRERGLKPHPYCLECGLVKNLSSYRPHTIGFFMNILAELGKDHKVAQVQMRLIAHELEKQGIEDHFGMDRHQQEILFVEIVKKSLNIPEKLVRHKLSE